MQVAPVAFRPIYGTAIQCPATTTSAAVAIPNAALGAPTVRVLSSTGSVGVRFRSGKSGVAAVTLIDPLILPYTAGETFGLNASDTHIAVITDAGTATLELVFGTGC
jgi:hypothetical protein